MGIDNILESNGFGIAATGMTIVFVALTVISVFIYLLPKVLSAFERVVPPASEPQVAALPPSSDDEQIAAVIGFALHQHEAQPNQRNS